jgi:adenylate cyclase class 2
MLEIEIKFRSPDTTAVAGRLSALGFGPATVTAERDHYFNAPDRDFAVTGEAFRVRRVGDTNAITYKGPKRAGATAKVRTEIELAVADGDEGFAAAAALLAGLGYRPVAVVRKTRVSRSSNRDGFTITVCLDECEGVGRFAEVEILAEEADRERAEAIVRGLATDLGLTEIEPRSYLRMTLDASAGAS